MQQFLLARVKSYFKILTSTEKLFYALIIYFASFSTFSAVPFYPLLFVPFLSFIPSLILYNKGGVFGVLSLAVLSLPAFLYQSTLFGWVYLFFFSLILFEMFDKWREISMLFLLIFLPFTPPPFNLFAWFHYLLLLISVFHFSSKRSLFIVSVSLFSIFFLSTIWGVFLPQYPLNVHLYKQHPFLDRKQPILFSLFDKEVEEVISNLTNFSVLLKFNEVLDVIFFNISTMFFSDSAFIQLLFWNFILYFSVFITGRIRVNQVESYATSFLFLSIPFYYFIYETMGLRYPLEHPMFVFLSLLSVFFLESKGFKFSREVEAIRKEWEKDLEVFGIRELTLSKGERGLSDVGGYEDVKKELKDALLFPLERKDIAYVYGLKPARGILLFGPPGTGKTMIMRALAKEIDYPFFYVKSTSILSKWMGESERRIREIFSRARKKAPAILFFDEIDSIARDRSIAGKEFHSIVAALLQELDGFREDKPVIFVAATNRPDMIDKALLRPGRIDKIIYMRPPNFEERKEIFKVKLSKYPTHNINFDRLAKLTERFSGADIDRVVREASLIAAERAKKSGKIEPITQEDLEFVIRNTKPSITNSMLELYERFKVEFERRTKTVKKESKLTFKDVVDMEKVKDALIKAVEIPLKYKDKMEEYGIEGLKGILLFGPPGTGKTYVVKAAAGEFSIPIFSLTASDLVSEGWEKASVVVKEVFNKARDSSPSIVFIDEIDTIGNRTTYPHLFNQLLQEMDGLKKSKDVVVIGATNEPWKLDPALIRAGRFDMLVYVGLPSKEDRKKLFKYYLKGIDIDLDKLVELSEGFTPADIKAVSDSIKTLFLMKDVRGEGKPSWEEIEKLLVDYKPSVDESLLKRYEEFLKRYGQRVL